MFCVGVIVYRIFFNRLNYNYFYIDVWNCVIFYWKRVLGICRKVRQRVEESRARLVGFVLVFLVLLLSSCVILDKKYYVGGCKMGRRVIFDLQSCEINKLRLVNSNSLKFSYFIVYYQIFEKLFSCCEYGFKGFLFFFSFLQRSFELQRDNFFFL